MRSSKIVSLKNPGGCGNKIRGGSPFQNSYLQVQCRQFINEEADDDDFRPEEPPNPQEFLRFPNGKDGKCKELSLKAFNGAGNKRRPYSLENLRQRSISTETTCRRKDY